MAHRPSVPSARRSTPRSAPGSKQATQRGHAAIERGDFAGAIEHFQERVRLEPESAEAHTDLAGACRYAWRLEEAVRHYERALAIAPDYAIAWHSLGVTLLDAGRPDAAVIGLKRALELRPGHVDTILTLIHACKRLDRLAEAAPLLHTLEERARKSAGSTEAATQLALAYAQFDRFAEAIAALEGVVKRKPRDFDALRFLGLLLIEEGRYDEALERFEQAVRVQPDSGEARFYRAIELLRAGRLPEGFAEYEWRWRSPNFTSPRLHTELAAWNGEAAPGATLLLHTEQGLGDSIQFARFIAAARQRVGRVVLECEPELARLLAGCAGIDQLVARGEPIPACDFHAPLLSLPHLLGVSAADLAGMTPYLRAEGQPTTTPTVGLVWAGSRGHANDANRSLPLDLLAPLAERGGVDFLSLQKGEPARDLAGLGDTRIRDGVAKATDLLDTARVVAGLDLVITVDTALAHLAGALGRPVWVLLPFDADWRWMTGREDSPWYPSMRLFRQPRRGDWTSVLDRVSAALDEHFSVQEPTPMPSKPEPRPAERADFAAAVRAHQEQRFAEAEALYQRAAAAEPNLPEVHNNLGALLAHLGRLDEAEGALRRAIALRPDYGEALNNLGIVVSRRGVQPEAASLFERATASDASRIDWWNNLGNVYLEQMRLEEALAAYDRAIALDPKYVFAVNNRGVALRGLARYDEAIQALERALEIDPDYVEAVNNLALVHRDRGDHPSATALQRRALEMAPERADVRVNLGINLQESGDFEGARRVAREILAMDPDCPDAHDIFGHCAFDEAKLDEAWGHFSRAAELNPADVNAQWNLSLLRLHRGEFGEGLKTYEWRKQLVSFALNARRTETPHWDGSPLAGRSVMIFSEQGLGDTLQFIRYAEGLKQAGAGAVYLECEAGLVKLMRTASGVDGVFAKGEGLPSFDLHAYVMSLPGLLGTTVETIPANIPYLAATETDLARMVRETPGLKVGIVWGGNPEFKKDARRSLHFGAIEHLAAIPGVQLFSLQVGAPAAQLAGSRYRDRIVDLGAEVARRGRDMTETAAAIAELDLVISTCTSVPHLAGALGKPIWVMLPYLPDWRWLLDREDTPWYPGARLFRQPRLDDWATPIARLTEELRRLAGADPMAPAVTLPPAQPELAAFFREQLRPGDLLLDIGAGLDDAAIGAASLPGRDVHVIAAVAEPFDAERLLSTAAAAELTGTVDVVTMRPDQVPIDEIVLRALRITTGNAFVRLARPGDLAMVLPRAAGLLSSRRLAAFVWPFRQGNQADSIALGGLQAFGYSHFHVRDGGSGPEMFPFDADAGSGLVFSLSMDYLAAALSEQTDEAPAPAAPAPTQAAAPVIATGEPMRVAFDWQISSSTGWGVYGLNLALHSLRTGRALPMPLAEPSLDGLEPLQRRLLAPMLDRARRPAEADLVLRALGNGLAGAGGETVPGRPEVGVVFFEDTAMDAATIERARRFDRIVAGSTWNGEVLRGYGLDNVEVSLQGIDPTVFHPAPRSGWLGDRFIVFSGGKLEYRKGQDIVVAAFREFHRRRPDSLLMVAWHNHWPQTMAEVTLRGLVRGVPRVDRQGRLDVGAWLVSNGIPAGAFVDLGLAPNHQMGRLVREADVALFPNRCEGGTNLVAMECMAAGVPTILSANTGHLDLVRESDCFGLYQQGHCTTSRQFRGVDGWGESSVEEIVSVLERVYTDREEAARRAKAGAERMQGFAWSHRIDELLGCLADLLSVPSI